jgi:hypothetical protein
LLPSRHAEQSGIATLIHKTLSLWERLSGSSPRPAETKKNAGNNDVFHTGLLFSYSSRTFAPFLVFRYQRTAFAEHRIKL